MKAQTVKDRSARTVERQIKDARAILRELHETLEDLQDIQALNKAMKRNAGKPGIPWEVAAKELGIRPPRKR
jgi:predicted AAA+ superfamily ATPase